MKNPFPPPIAPGDPATIVAVALQELGLSEDFMIRALIKEGHELKFKDGRIDFLEMAASTWFMTCQKLHLHADSICYGYASGFHRRQVGKAILDGTYTLPMTRETKLILRDFITRSGSDAPENEKLPIHV